VGCQLTSLLVRTRGVEAFLKKTAIAYGGDPSKKAKFWWYAIAVFFKNASTPRVKLVVMQGCFFSAGNLPSWQELPFKCFGAVFFDMV